MPWWTPLAILGGLVGLGVAKMAWFYQRYGKEAERRCKHVRTAQAHDDCVRREIRKMKRS